MSLDIYFRSDIAQGIQAALCLAVKMYVRADSHSPEYIRGMFDLAEHQAEMYGLNWRSILHNVKESLGTDMMAAIEPAWPVLEAKVG